MLALFSLFFENVLRNRILVIIIALDLFRKFRETYACESDTGESSTDDSDTDDSSTDHSVTDDSSTDPSDTGESSTDHSGTDFYMIECIY